MNEFREVIEFNAINRRIKTRYVSKYELRFTFKNIITTISKYFDIHNERLKSKSRKRELVQVRQIITSFCYILMKTSLEYVSKETFSQDHATILYSKKTVLNLIETDIDYQEDIINICKIFYIDFNYFYDRLCQRRSL